MSSAPMATEQSSSKEICTLSLHFTEAGLEKGRTVMSKQQVVLLLAASVARKHKRVVPISKLEPLGIGGDAGTVCTTVSGLKPCNTAKRSNWKPTLLNKPGALGEIHKRRHYPM